MKRACLTSSIWFLSVVFAVRFMPTVNCITDEEGESSPKTILEDVLADNFMDGKSSDVILDELISVVESYIKEDGYGDADSFQMKFNFIKSAIERMETGAESIDIKLEEARINNDELGIIKLLKERKEIVKHETKMFQLLDDMLGIFYDVDEEYVGDDEEGEEEEFNPMGLQIWDEDSLLRAFADGRLLLVILVAPWCDKGNEFVKKEAALAADMVDETFESHLPSLDLPTTARKPLIGTLDPSSVDEDILFNLFGTVTHYPALKFVRLAFSNGDEDGACDSPDNDEECKNDDGDGGSQIQAWDYIGPRETSKDIYDSVLMYWYRFVVSNELTTPDDEDAKEVGPPIFTFSSQNELMTFLQIHGDSVLRPAQTRHRHKSTLEEEVFNFYMGLNDDNDVAGVFHPYELGNGSMSKEDCQQKYTQEIDPFILLVQCRSQLEYGEIDLDDDEVNLSADEIILAENQRQAVKDFDDLSLEMVHRVDVAFVALNATLHNTDAVDPIEQACDVLFEDIGGPMNGDVAFVRARRYVSYSVESDAANDHTDEKQTNSMWNQHRRRVIHNVQTDWGGVEQVSPHAIFVPSATHKLMPEEQTQMHGKFANKKPQTTTDYIQSNLVASTIIHSTPTVMWYDKERTAQLAFPWYRKIHAVLFVDMGLSYKEWRTKSLNHPPWPSSLNHSTETATLLFRQQKAIQMFYNAALRHRVERPDDDMVFLIVPSSETRIMTTFGIDIWSPLDEALFNMTYDDSEEEDEQSQSSATDDEYCNSSNNEDSRSVLPIMMITDSSNRSGLQSSRYYLCSNDILSDDSAIQVFIDKFFDGTIGKPFTRSETLLPNTMTQTTSTTSTQANVTIVTGNTFESVVMDRNDEHTMLLIQSYSCGHCKRFSIFWNELSLLVQAMNWSSVINVAKIDVSKNDVPHEKINAWDLPSVYYFPAYEKDDPIEMTPVEGKTNPQNDYDEGLSWVNSGYDLIKWMVSQNKLELEHLLELGESGREDSLISADI